MHEASPGEALAAAERLADWLEAHDLEGWDPYDALRSRAVAWAARTPRARQVAIQLVRRCPVNPRPLLGIRPYANAKGLGLVALAAARLHRATGGPRWRPLAELAAARAAELAVEAAGGRAWGYPFDVQLRWGFYGADTPNVIATVFTARALAAAADLLERPDLEAAALPAAVFLDSLERETAGERYYAYVPDNPTPIHNASLLAAAARAELARRRGEAAPPAVAAAVRFSVTRQRPAGFWPYGEAPGLGFVDGFHTAYVLGALADLDGSAVEPEVAAAAARGAAFYVERFFEDDGAPRYLADRLHPLDSHNGATAVATLLRLGRYEPRAPALAGRVVGWLLRRMQTREGWFLYQRGRLHAKRVPYMRWSDAHVLAALAAFVEAGTNPPECSDGWS